jgi:hypothetical protein
MNIQTSLHVKAFRNVKALINQLIWFDLFLNLLELNKLIWINNTFRYALIGL